MTTPHSSARTHEVERLEREAAAALKDAHEAPLNPYRLDADGHRWVEPQSNAWAKAADRWVGLRNQIALIKARSAA